MFTLARNGKGISMDITKCELYQLEWLAEWHAEALEEEKRIRESLR